MYNDATVEVLELVKSREVRDFVGGVVRILRSIVRFHDFVQNYRHKGRNGKVQGYFLADHQRNTARLGFNLAKDVIEEGFAQTFAQLLLWACLIHDIGKILFPFHRNTGELGRVQRAMRRYHALAGYWIVMLFARLTPHPDARRVLCVIARAIRWHHEPDKAEDELVGLLAFFIRCSDSVIAATEDRGERRVADLREAIARNRLELCHTSFDCFGELRDLVLASLLRMEGIRFRPVPAVRLMAFAGNGN